MGILFLKADHFNDQSGNILRSSQQNVAVQPPRDLSGLVTDCLRRIDPRRRGEFDLVSSTREMATQKRLRICLTKAVDNSQNKINAENFGDVRFRTVWGTVYRVRFQKLPYKKLGM